MCGGAANSERVKHEGCTTEEEAANGCDRRRQLRVDAAGFDDAEVYRRKVGTIHPVDTSKDVAEL